MWNVRVLLTVCLILATFGPAFGQSGWVEFTDETATRLVADPALGASDTEEKDYAWGDVDKDGDIDIVCVRKEPFTTPGQRPNVLFMNGGYRRRPCDQRCVCGSHRALCIGCRRRRTVISRCHE